MPARPVVGRDAELAVIEEFLVRASEASSVLLIEGEPGIGKTTLWQEAVRRGEEHGMRVLSSRPGPSETRLTFVGLADFLAGVDDDVLQELPPPQRRALDVALMRSDPKGPAPEQRVVSTAFLSALRLLSGSTPVVVGVDDLQWLDTPSRHVLEFAMRRLESEPVGFLGAVRVDGSSRTVAGEWARRIRLSPLNLAALHEILKAELGRTFARPALLRIGRASSGNPFFALELARALLEHGEPVRGSAPLPVPSDLTALIAGRLRRLSAASRQALLVASALPQPMLEMLDRDAVAEAETAGVVRIDERGRVFFAHPLLAAAVYASAPVGRRRDVHRGLAQRVTDAEERARHLALAADGPDEAVGRALADAAQAARDRGAPDAAIELLELSCDMTPAEHRDALYSRMLELGRYLSEAGDPERAEGVLRDVAERAPAGRLRARALLLLAFRSETSEAGEVATRLCEQALSHAGDDVDLRTEILAAASRMSDDDVERKTSYARAAMELAERGQVSPQLQAYASLAFAEAEFFAGRGIAVEAFRRAAELESTSAVDGGLGPATRSLHRVHHYSDIRPSARLLGILRIYADELDGARTEFEVEREVASEHGDEVQLARTLIRLGVIELRAGSWDVADQHLGAAASVLERTRQEALRRWMLATKASLDALRGRVDEARAAGEEALGLSVAAGALWGVAECHAALGFLELSLGGLHAARHHFDRAAEINDSIGPEEPRLLRYHADLTETLVALGDLDRAETVLLCLERSGKAAGSAWAAATGARCRGLLCSARGDLDGAARSFEEAVVAHERLPIPFELGRTLLGKGQIHRRRNERRLAKDALGRSLTIFEELGAPLWVERAQAEMRRLGLRRGAPDELTPSEETVASLAASGLTNREIAERAFVSPKTVEANLSRVYRKLGIHSRAELGAWMAERGRLTKT